jgi:hypothetical protein
VDDSPAASSSNLGRFSYSYFFFLFFIVISAGAWGCRRRAGGRDAVLVMARPRLLSGGRPGRPGDVGISPAATVTPSVKLYCFRKVKSMESVKLALWFLHS